MLSPPPMTELTTSAGPGPGLTLDLRCDSSNFTATIGALLDEAVRLERRAKRAVKLGLAFGFAAGVLVAALLAALLGALRWRVVADEAAATLKAQADRPAGAVAAPLRSAVAWRSALRKAAS